jgi:hypothetical protein
VHAGLVLLFTPHAMLLYISDVPADGQPPGIAACGYSITDAQRLFHVQLDAQEATIAALRREVHALRSENEHLRSETLASAASAGVGRVAIGLHVQHLPKWSSRDGESTCFRQLMLLLSGCCVSLQVTLPPGSPDPASQLLGASATPAADAAAFSGPNLAAAQLPAAAAAGATAGPLPNPAVAAAAVAADVRPRAASPGPLHNSPLAKAHAPGGAPLTGHARQVRQSEEGLAEG